MPICASCGQPVDATPVQRACPSCTWRAALRASKAVVAQPAAAEVDTTTSASGAGGTNSIDLLRADDDPTELMDRLLVYTAMAGETVGPAAARVYLALLRGNPRPYYTELNRLVGRFMDRLEDAWKA